MTEAEVKETMQDIRFLSAEAKVFFIKSMKDEDSSIVNYPVIKNWIKRNRDLSSKYL